MQSDNDKLREVRQKAAMAEHLRDKELLKELLARPEGVTKRPPPRIDPKREAFFANMREQVSCATTRHTRRPDRTLFSPANSTNQGYQYQPHQPSTRTPPTDPNSPTPTHQPLHPS